MRPFALSFALSLCLATIPSFAAGPAKKAPKKEEPPPLPPAEARFVIIAPTTTGPWTLRIDNDGKIPLRIPADARLLKLVVDTPVEKAKPVTCAAPKALRPEAFPETRALLLGPGESYAETFDPLLYCFGKDAAALQPNALVHASFGWEPPKKQGKKPSAGPFAVETTQREPTIASLPVLVAPSILLGADVVPSAPAVAPAVASPGQNGEGGPKPEAKPEDGKGEVKAEPKTEAPATKPLVDERAGRLVLSTPAFVDASSPRGVTIAATAKNDGLRPITVALRPWMLSFHIEGPYGHVVDCPSSPARGLPRDAFTKLSPGKSTTFSVILAEVCPRDSFPRPGTYRITTTLSAGETLPNVDAYTAEVTTPTATILRVVDAPNPFHADAPRAIPSKAF